MSGLIGTALSGLMSSQSLLNTTSNNIANVNTAGYSRQNVDLGASPGLLTGAGYMGQGVNVTTVARSYNQFITNQLTSSTSAYAQANTLSTLASGVDNIVADQTTGLSAVFSAFANATAGVANDPTSIPARQAMLSAAGSVTQQFNSLSSQFDNLRNQANNQMQTSVDNINAYAAGVATLNSQIIAASNATGAPNDLLDQRDALVAKIAEQVSISTVTQPNGGISLIIGNGQSLVSGTSVAQLSVAGSATDSAHKNILMGGQDISRQVSGGALSGALQFRNEVLDPAQQQLGLVATGFAVQFNAAHTAGYDLSGAAGTALFSAGTPTVVTNAANVGTISAAYNPSTLGALTPSDYQFSYDGSNFSLKRLSDNTVTTMPGPPPATLTGPGFNISVAATVAANDSFLIRPTFDAAKKMTALMTDPTLIAAAGAAGSPGDNSNAQILAKLGNTPVLLGGKATFHNAYNQLVTNVGVLTQASKTNSSAQQALLNQATTTRNNLSGVNLDEEAANLIKFQQSYQAASKVISIASSLFDTLIGAVR